MARITRRRLISFGCSTAALGLLAACGQAAPPTATPAPAKPATGAAATKPAAGVAATKPAASAAATKPAEAPKAAGPAQSSTPVMVSFTSQGNKAELAMFDTIFDTLEKKSGKVKVDRKYDTTLSWPKVINQLRSGTASDVIRTNDDDIFLLTSANVITSLDDYIRRDLRRDDYFPVAWERRTGPGGELGSALVATSAYIMFYNVDLFQKAGVKPPTDWDKDNWTMDDFEAALPKLTVKNGSRVDQFAWWSDPYWWQVGLWNDGVPWYNEDETKAIVKTPEALRDMEKYQRWHKEGWAVPPGENPTQLFNGGLLAMRFSDNSFESSIKPGLNWDVGPVFKGSKHDGCFHNDRNFTIPQHSKVKDNAWELLKWFFAFDGDGSGQVEFAKLRWGIPVHKKATEIFSDPKKGPKHVAVYFQGVEKAWPIPDNPMGEAFQVVWRGADTLRTGQDTPEKFLTDAENLLNSTIKQTGWSKKSNVRGYRLEGVLDKAGLEPAANPATAPTTPAKKP